MRARRLLVFAVLMAGAVPSVAFSKVLRVGVSGSPPFALPANSALRTAIDVELVNMLSGGRIQTLIDQGLRRPSLW